MAKQSGGMPKIDEDFMRELISQGVPAKRESQPDDEPQPGSETETAHEGRQAETVQVEKPTPPQAQRAVRATTGKPTFRKWNWQTDSPCT